MKYLAVLALFPFALAAQPVPYRGQGRQFPGGAQPGGPQSGAQQPGAMQPGATQQAPPVPTKPEDLCTVEGQAVNAMTGEPLKKATVLLRRAEMTQNAPGPRAYSATTDGAGNFLIGNVEPGKYRLAATRTGFVDADYGTRDYLQSGAAFSLTAKQHMTNAVLRMNPHAVITGRVADEDGDPMASVQVQALRYRYAQGGKQLTEYGSASTNDLGEYRIAGLPPGRYYISASARRNYMSDRMARAAVQQQADEEYVRMYYPGTLDPAAAAPLDATPGTTLRGADLSLTKRHTVTVRGRVIDASGSDARRVMLYLTQRDLAGPAADRASRIDANGTFEIRGVPAGSYTMVASIVGRVSSLTAHAPVNVAEANIDNLSITINPAISVAGRVRVEGQTATSISNVKVALRAQEGGGTRFSPNMSGTVGDDGAFTVANVNPDRYNLTLSGMPDGFYIKAIRAGSQDALTTGLDLSNGTAGPIEVVLSPHAGQVTGAVQNDQQQPAAGAIVVLVPQEPERRAQPQYYKTATANDAGQFTVKNIDPGQYKAYAWPEVESGAYMDPDFLRPVENRGETVKIGESAQETVQLKLIS